jgi:hypothetical protein
MLKLGNEEHNLEHFLFPDEYQKRPDGDCQDIILTDEVVKRIKSKTPARTPANRPFGNSKQSHLWEYSQYFDNLLYKKDFADAVHKQMLDAHPDYSPEYALTLNTNAASTEDASIFIKDFANRLRANLNKGTKKEERISPKIIATMEYSQNGYKHWHLEVDTCKRISKENLGEFLRMNLTKCRFGKSDFKNKIRENDGWFHYMWKQKTSVGEDKNYFIYN